MLSTPDAAGSSEHLVRLDGEMAEMLLLLPARQAAALERAARQRGLTSAQLTRRLIGAFLEKTGRPAGPAPDLGGLSPF
jgi:hypothetical protein